MSDALVITKLSKDYRALRPLRIASLTLRSADRMAILGLDAPAAETLVNLITGATLPEQGSISVFGQRTAALTDADAWFGLLDKIGIVTPRAVLVEALTLRQNLTMPFTLEVDSPPAEIAERVARLAVEVGIDASVLDADTAVGSADVRTRIHLGRALALDPMMLLLEHPTSAISADAGLRLGHDVARIAEHRGLAVLALTADRDFASAMTDRLFTLQPSTGALTSAGGWRRLLGR